MCRDPRAVIPDAPRCVFVTALPLPDGECLDTLTLETDGRLGMAVPESSMARLLIAALLLALAFIGLDVVDSERTIVAAGGWLWFAAFGLAAVALAIRTLTARSR